MIQNRNVMPSLCNAVTEWHGMSWNGFEASTASAAAIAISSTRTGGRRTPQGNTSRSCSYHRNLLVCSHIYIYIYIYYIHSFYTYIYIHTFYVWLTISWLKLSKQRGFTGSIEHWDQQEHMGDTWHTILVFSDDFASHCEACLAPPKRLGKQVSRASQGLWKKKKLWYLTNRLYADPLYVIYANTCY